MPQKHTLKEYVAESYYHVFVRGVNKRTIFAEAADYAYFLSLFDRYLSGPQRISRTGALYPAYADELDLVAYCLMNNHVHLLVYQKQEPLAIKKFMSSLLTSYSKYFNAKYHRVGSLFESRYKAKRIDDASYLTHISRYIHMNPRRWLGYTHSSLRYFIGEQPPEWLKPTHALQEFATPQDYLQFLHEYQDQKTDLETIKQQLADN